jgi:hypothetical protein
MFYTVASAEWSPERALTPVAARGGLYRSRFEAEAIADGRPTLAVALRYDANRGVVLPQGPVARARAGQWSAPAVMDARGSVTVFAAIPAALVRVVGPVEVRSHSGVLRVVPRPHRPSGPDPPRECRSNRTKTDAKAHHPGIKVPKLLRPSVSEANTFFGGKPSALRLPAGESPVTPHFAGIVRADPVAVLRFAGLPLP